MNIFAPASETTASVSPVAGLGVLNVLPEALSMKDPFTYNFLYLEEISLPFHEDLQLVDSLYNPLKI